MYLQRITPKELFLSGSDESSVYGGEHTYHYRGGEITFIPDKLPSFIEEEQLLPSDIFRELHDNISGIQRGLINYTSEEGLKLYLYETDDCYTVIAAGEFQPGLHRIYIEGVFRKT
jgi:hypothetical protein